MIMEYTAFWELVIGVVLCNHDESEYVRNMFEMYVYYTGITSIPIYVTTHIQFTVEQVNASETQTVCFLL